MVPKWILATVALVGFGFTTASHAAPRDLVGIDGSGNKVSSGWTWDISAAQESLANLVFIRLEGNNFFFEKDAHLTSATEPLVITFNKVDPNAKNLVINDENITNRTGTDWTSFRFDLSSGSSGATPNFAFATSNGATGIGDFNIDPFTTFAFQNTNSSIQFGGGTVKNGATWFPGSQSTTGLMIVANGQTATTFSLKETPNGIPIPVPAAAWSGLTVLAGLAAIKAANRLRRIA